MDYFCDIKVIMKVKKNDKDNIKDKPTNLIQIKGMVKDKGHENLHLFQFLQKEE